MMHIFGSKKKDQPQDSLKSEFEKAMGSSYDSSKVDWNNSGVLHIAEESMKAINNLKDEVSLLRRITGISATVYDVIKKGKNVYDELMKAMKAKQQQQSDHSAVPKDDKDKDKQPRQSYNVREYKDYPNYKPDNTNKEPTKPRKIVIINTKVADDLYCPTCGAKLSNPTEKYCKTTEDLNDGKITGTEWTVVRRYCKKCGKQKTSVPDGVLPREHYGINIMSMVILLKCMLVSFDGAQEFINAVYGVKIPKSTLSHFCDVVSRKLEPLYNEMKDNLRDYDAVAGDDTKWFIGKVVHYAWTFIGLKNRLPHTIIYHIAESRGIPVTQKILGKDYKGLILSDSHGSWNHVGGKHQKCLLHYFRDMHKTLKANYGREFNRFYQVLHQILKDAIDASGDNPKVAKELTTEVLDLIIMGYQDEDCKRYVKRLNRENGDLFTFLENAIDYHNNVSERSIRPFSRARLIHYGNRSKKGAHQTEILMSMYGTCKARKVNFYQFLQEYLAGTTTTIPDSVPKQ